MFLSSFFPWCVWPGEGPVHEEMTRVFKSTSMLHGHAANGAMLSNANKDP
jgi:hypothetical protein